MEMEGGKEEQTRERAIARANLEHTRAVCWCAFAFVSVSVSLSLSLSLSAPLRVSPSKSHSQLGGEKETEQESRDEGEREGKNRGGRGEAKEYEKFCFLRTSNHVLHLPFSKARSSGYLGWGKLFGGSSGAGQTGLFPFGQTRGGRSWAQENAI